MAIKGEWINKSEISTQWTTIQQYKEMDYWHMLQYGSLPEKLHCKKAAGQKNSTCCKFLILWNLENSRGMDGKDYKTVLENIWAW